MKVAEAEITAVKLTNERFYRALTNLDIAAMETVWAHDEGARCIHPGWEIIEGWEVVRQSWDLIFASTKRLTVEPSEVKVRVEGDMAWVCCLETITSGGDQAVSVARATNLFVRTPEGWKMILHHASPVPPSDREGAADDEDEPTVH